MNVIQINKFGTIGLGAVIMLAASMGGSYAAKISNKDSAAQTIVVTEGASKREMVVAPGDTVDFCASGCFVTFPNGDREALTGDETITLTGGKATLK
ncbi:hypothetical protein QBD01_004204 [Ochrobactrum sp. 19YEA23]|uniref:hypothetical protein n=1 Tax=Brucella/Ochrobactrum group TaxID=2826938 RepID=UPI00110D2A4F|nr:hypothetical protein [Brucella haematophila]KAB2699654.1 hypothetical protein F9K79_07190 [Ochrobactrum sp. Kaboul]MDH7788168.1 hypothetical protein [Ochrobactrum sp. 19YEA23]URQ75647.1 MAG: hypothetical protein NBV76_02375 [Candidatus Ochrobactrum gambitense]TMU96372.1 hypothetical protein FGI60_17590 [Brucella haematophila]WEK15566.1 MAG: hypothetical protein P0Y54_08585 [Candidatus Ochrobactrum gambitense]